MRIHMRVNNKSFQNSVSLQFESDNMAKSFILERIEQVFDLFHFEDMIEVYVSEHTASYSLTLGTRFTIEKKLAFEKFPLWTLFDGKFNCIEARVDREEIISFACDFIKKHINELGGDSNEVTRDHDSN